MDSMQNLATINVTTDDSLVIEGAEISEATGRRIIRAGKVRVTQLSERRIGIGEDDNADYQARGARGEPP
jgi:predicted site-specific integrase-resolvase